MTTLVGYGSSSDEDEATLTRDSPHEKATGPRPQEHPPASESRHNDHGARIGPTLPDEAENGAEDDFQAGGSPSMSERDALRYLTQTSHPMTSMPPSPAGSPNLAMGAKFKRFLDLKAQGVHFNEDLAKKATFQNPSLFATLMTRGGLAAEDQYATSLPREVWDPYGFPSGAYKEELLRNQQTLRDKEKLDKKALSAAGKRLIEFTAGRNSGSSSRESTPGIPQKRKKP